MAASRKSPSARRGTFCLVRTMIGGGQPLQQETVGVVAGTLHKPASVLYLRAIAAAGATAVSQRDNGRSLYYTSMACFSKQEDTNGVF